VTAKDPEGTTSKDPEVTIPDSRTVVSTTSVFPAVPGIEGPLSKADRVELDAAVTDMRRRSNVGYGLGATAIVGAVVLAIYSFCSLHRMAGAFSGGGTDRPLEVFYVSVGGHAAITIAMVWFIYQVLRAAERMALPRHLLSGDADMARTLLGISSPHREVQQLLKQALSLVVRTKPGEE
jgi:hypothetical protein